jgi:hypothetical protein
MVRVGGDAQNTSRQSVGRYAPPSPQLWLWAGEVVTHKSLNHCIITLLSSHLLSALPLLSMRGHDAGYTSANSYFIPIPSESVSWL